MVKIINVGNDGIDKQEWKKIKEELQAGEQVKIVDSSENLLKVLNASDLGKITQDQLNTQVSQSGDGLSPKEAQLKGKMDQLVSQIEQLEQQGASEDEISLKQAELAEIVKQANQAFANSGKAFDLNPYYKAAGVKNPLSGDVNAQVVKDQQGNPLPQTPYSSKAQTSSGFTPPADWGAQVFDGMPQFNSDAYIKTMSMESNIMDSWDAINNNTNKGKQLMLLFYQYARMAESGDMTAMYQFMKFITYVISKDKAKQQIEMGKKLIQLQELSRQWTNKLLDVQTDSSDPNASSELMKTMTLVKAETDAIATSQKLISQMMEEFAQVVETTTNVTKGALDTAGRILRRVSTFGG